MASTGWFTTWSVRPAREAWDAAAAVRGAMVAPRSSGFVPLATLVTAIGQGIGSGRIADGNVAVNMQRSSDMQPIFLAGGDRQFVSEEMAYRHAVRPGDVLVARVGRQGRACCVGNEDVPVIPRGELFVVRPRVQAWGPVIAAALSTGAVKEWISHLPTGALMPTLTKATLGQIPVPKPGAFPYEELVERAWDAEGLVRSARRLRDSVRQRIGLLLEKAPATGSAQTYLEIRASDLPADWGWREVSQTWLLRQARRAVKGLSRFGDLIDHGSHRARTTLSGESPFVLRREHLRADWYLAIPEVGPAEKDAEQAVADGGEPAKKNRADGVDRESLLIPVIGDIMGTPGVVPAEIVDRASSPLLVGTYWLPVVSPRYPRALAAILDHPFLRLQRQLAGSYASTAPHIAREEIGNLLLPNPPESQWNQLENDLRAAQEQFLKASSMVNEVLEEVENWYR